MVENADIDAVQLPPADDGAKRPERIKLFLRLFLQNERRLYAYIMTLLPNRSDADDVLQETSLIMWDKFDMRQPPDDFVAWGCRIAYFKVLDFCKKRRRSHLMFNQDIVERVSETALEHASSLQLDDRREALNDCIGKLRPGDRELLSRRFAPGATIKTAAPKSGLSVDAAYKALSRIRKSLFDCVTRTLAAEARS